MILTLPVSDEHILMLLDGRKTTYVRRPFISGNYTASVGPGWTIVFYSGSSLVASNPGNVIGTAILIGYDRVFVNVDNHGDVTSVKRHDGLDIRPGALAHRDGYALSAHMVQGLGLTRNAETELIVLKWCGFAASQHYGKE